MVAVSVARDLSTSGCTGWSRSRHGVRSIRSGSAGRASGIAWGLSATLLGKMDFRDGAPVQSSYRDFRVLTIDRMPAVETHILPSAATPDGFGEHPVPTVAPAVANAVFAATGRRVRDLPITPEKLAARPAS
jgi:CO/xanthine dehydrogenase Mo-binding subunit